MAVGLGAMTIVEVIDAHDGFALITSRIRTQRLTSLLWQVAWMTFVLSALLALTGSLAACGPQANPDAPSVVADTAANFNQPIDARGVILLNRGRLLRHIDEWRHRDLLGLDIARYRIEKRKQWP